jgi:hypothetical protein
MTDETSKISKTSDKKKVDMSARAVTERLRMVSDLRELCLALGKSRLVSAGAPKNSPKTK